jgi:hypothetical protein
MSQATLRDLCAEAVSIEGTGAATFLGAMRGHRSFSEAYAGVLPITGVNIKIEEANAQGYIVRWEQSTCTVTTTGFTRVTCISSSNSNAFVEFGTGYKRAFVFIPVADLGSGGGAVSSVAGRTGAVTLSTADVSGLGTLATQSGTFSGTSSGTNTGDQTNISGNAATVTTNANLTGHVTSVGNAAVLGSFTKAQLTAAVSDGDPLYVGDVAGMEIGGAITSATASRILTTDASSQLATSTAWQFGDLAFGAGMTSRQTLRGTIGADGFLANISGGALLGREDAGVSAFIGYFTHNGITIPVGGKIGFGHNVNDYRLADALIERHAENIITGAALKMRTSTVAGLASLDAATWIDTQVICTDEAGGRVPVFSDGTNWRRVTDRAIAS